MHRKGISGGTSESIYTLCEAFSRRRANKKSVTEGAKNCRLQETAVFIFFGFKAYCRIISSFF